MLDWTFLLSFFASTYAAAEDIRSGKISTWLIALLMTCAFSLHLITAIADNSLTPLVLSFFSSAAVLIVGAALHRVGLGAGDVWVPAAMMFMSPSISGQPILFIFMPLSFVIGSAYMLIHLIYFRLSGRSWPVRLCPVFPIALLLTYFRL